MKKVMILLSLCLLLSGCAMTGDTWYHPYGPEYSGGAMTGDSWYHPYGSEYFGEED